MVLDLAYGMRRILADLGCPDDGVCAVLTHSTDRNTSAAELATANAYACLKELQHYREAGYQPAGFQADIQAFLALLQPFEVWFA